MKRSKDWDDIKVNKRSTDKIYFETPFIQSISDGIDFLRGEAKELLNELDSTEFKQKIDKFDLDEFGEDAFNQISELTDSISQFRSQFFNSEDLPDFVKESTRSAKFALNRDSDYVRKAKRKLNRLESDEGFVDAYKTNIRVVELCDKAIDVNYKNWQAYYVKAQALINLEKYNDAIKELVKSLALNEENLDAWYDIARSYRLNGNYSQSIDVYDSILKRDDESFEALLGKAIAYFEARDAQNADSFFKKANSIKILDGDAKEMWQSIQEDN